MVVDDMTTMRKIIIQQLKTLGITEIMEANDGSVAWETLKNAPKPPVDLVISDWSMPQMKGIDLLKNCRTHASYKDLAFILITAESETAYVKEALAAGVDNYLVKPFNPQSFKEKFSAVVKKRFGI
jgi:two-component system chemotaxis response regulator CheY